MCTVCQQLKREAMYLISEIKLIHNEEVGLTYWYLFYHIFTSTIGHYLVNYRLRLDHVTCFRFRNGGMCVRTLAHTHTCTETENPVRGGRHMPPGKTCALRMLYYRISYSTGTLTLLHIRVRRRIHINLHCLFRNRTNRKFRSSLSLLTRCWRFISFLIY